MLVARSADGEICAIHAACSHLGGPLDEGERDGNVITCPWRATQFDLCTGEVLAARRSTHSRATRCVSAKDGSSCDRRPPEAVGGRRWNVRLGAGG